MGVDRPEPGPGQHQERLGGGRDISDRRRLCRRLQKLGGALQKARSPRRQVRRKILRNKHPPSSNRFHFVHTFAFDCIHTSYFPLNCVQGVRLPAHLSVTSGIHVRTLLEKSLGKTTNSCLYVV
jgi:hypothetical protein